MTFSELLEEAKQIEITDEEINELRCLLIQKGIESEERERRNYSLEVLNRTYSI